MKTIAKGILLAMWLWSHAALSQTNQAPCPDTITTTNGVVYKAVKLVRCEPDGLVIEYSPASGSIGIAKLRFPSLPESLQKRYGYDREKSASYSNAQARAMSQYVVQMWVDEHNGKVRRAERESREADIELKKAELRLQAAKEKFEAALRVQEVEAAQKLADAAMLQARTPPIIYLRP